MNIIIKPNIKDILRRGRFDIVYFVNEVLEEELHAEQTVWLKESLFKNGFLRAGNRWGKGDCGYFKGAFYSFYRPVGDKYKGRELYGLNTSASQDQANIILDKFVERYTKKKHFTWMIKDIKYSPFPHIIFKNKVTWWFRNASQDGKFLEGRSYFFANLDEADLIKDVKHIVENTIEPRLWDYGGWWDAMTTPRRGKKNAYHLEKKILDDSADKNFSFVGCSLNNTFLDPSAKDRMAKLSDRLYRQNVKAEWVDEDGAIASGAIERAQTLATGLQSSAAPGKRYVNAWDLARSSTWCTRATFTDELPMQLVSWERFKENVDRRNPEYWQMVEAKIKARHAAWPGKTCVDVTGLGDVVSSYITSVHPIALSFATGSGGSRLKNDIIENGITMLEHGEIGIPEGVEQVSNDGNVWTLEGELRDFETNTEGLIWDMVCSIFMAAWIVKGKNVKREVEPCTLTVCGIKGVSKYVAVQR